MEDSGTLSVRSYTLTQNTHSHGYHQVVVPLTGTMTITFATQTYSAAPGHCVVIPSGTVHRYSAFEQSRFLVADMSTLPKNAATVPEPCVAISKDLLAFCAYAEVQLTKAADREVAGLLYRLFWRLIAEQDFASRVDERIMRAVMKMEEDLSVNHSIAELAATAFLSVSQFKVLFRKHLGIPCNELLTKRRMERAKTLLTNTDYPVSIVALEVGYEDASAFSRRFRAHFGQSPRELARGG
jgi:AraC-like DNA-binding protein